MTAIAILAPQTKCGHLYRLTFPNGKSYIGITSRTAKPEQIEKARVANTGRVRPQHEVEKIRAAMLGRIMTAEHKENLRKAASGRVMSKESIEKQWATRRANAEAKRILAQKKEPLWKQSALI